MPEGTGIMIRRITLCSLWLVGGAMAVAAEQPEYWAQHNKDGHWRNSNATPVQGNLRVRWARTMTGFQVGDDTIPSSYQRSNNLSVRNGRILMIVPSSDPIPESSRGVRYASYGIYHLSDGTLINSTISPHYGAGGLESGAGTMDSDTAAGLINQFERGEVP